MPIEKFRSVAEMPGAARRTPLDPDNIRIACDLSETARRLHRRPHRWYGAEEAAGHVDGACTVTRRFAVD